MRDGCLGCVFNEGEYTHFTILLPSLLGDADLGAQASAAGPHTRRGAKSTGLVSGRIHLF